MPDVAEGADGFEWPLGFGGRIVGGGRFGKLVPVEGLSGCHSTPPGPIS